MENTSGEPGTKERCQAAFKRDVFLRQRKPFGGQGGKAQPEKTWAALETRGKSRNIHQTGEPKKRATLRRRWLRLALQRSGIV